VTTTQARDARQTALLSSPAYWYYVLGLLTLCYVANVMDRSSILAASLQSIKREFGASDFQMGILSGLPFAIFYSFLGIPIAAYADRTSRRKVLSLAVALWSAATMLCGAAVGFATLFMFRVGCAIGEAGGTPPAHSLISDYFPRLRRGTAFSIYALAVPVGSSLGAAVGGWGNQHLGWRMTFALAGAPGLLLALLVAVTVIESPRGFADGGRAHDADGAPPLPEALRFLSGRASFRHLCLGCAVHAIVWYAGGAFNNAFLQRTHHLPVQQAAYWVSVFAAVAAVGTFAGGFASDRISKWTNDHRWYVWVPGLACLLSIPFQFGAYLAPGLPASLTSFASMMFMAAVFFGPSFAMTQALAPVRMRSVATSILLLVQTLIGQGIGPALTGFVSDRLVPSAGTHSLAWALVIVGLVNVWAAGHFLVAGRTIRADLLEADALGGTAH
jgi:MFS family permease